MNVMYSDYYGVAAKYGLDRPEFYADLAKAFLMDLDDDHFRESTKMMEFTREDAEKWYHTWRTRTARQGRTGRWGRRTRYPTSRASTLTN